MKEVGLLTFRVKLRPQGIRLLVELVLKIHALLSLFVQLQLQRLDFLALLGKLQLKSIRLLGFSLDLELKISSFLALDIEFVLKVHTLLSFLRQLQLKSLSLLLQTSLKSSVLIFKLPKERNFRLQFLLDRLLARQRLLFQPRSQSVPILGELPLKRVLLRIELDLEGARAESLLFQLPLELLELLHQLILAFLKLLSVL
mmetsp:Transcript_46394/g.83757  ORF Transcript_46394/g.83757 Transcript_46394/m.83757 type:complete len:200 (-) Transcript_46394:1972-2571(-)